MYFYRAGWGVGGSDSIKYFPTWVLFLFHYGLTEGLLAQEEELLFCFSFSNIFCLSIHFPIDISCIIHSIVSLSPKGFVCVYCLFTCFTDPVHVSVHFLLKLLFLLEQKKPCSTLNPILLLRKLTEIWTEYDRIF